MKSSFRSAFGVVATSAALAASLAVAPAAHATSPSPAGLAVLPTSLTFDMTANTAAPPQSVTVSNTGSPGQPLTWVSTSNDTSITMSPNGGIVPGGASSPVQVTVAPQPSVGSRTQTVLFSAGLAGTVRVTVNIVVTSPCPRATKANFRWHYTANGNAGGWSGTTTQACPGSVSMGPQAMDGNLHVAPGTTLQAGYDFTLPGNHNSLTITVSAATVTFAVACVSGATPSASTLTVPMRDQTYQITNDQWYPSGDQSSPLVYQGSVTVPDLCGGGTISLAKGGTFTATLS